MEHKRSTHKLFEDAKKMDIDEYLELSSQDYESSGIQLLNKYLAEKKMTLAEVARNAEIDNSYVGKIFNGERNPSRDYMISICCGLHLEIEEVNEVLKRNGIGVLSANNNKRDAIIVYGVVNHQTVMKINSQLERHGLKMLGTNKR